METLHFKKLNELQANEQHHAEISNRFAALKNVNPKVDITGAWKIIIENTKNVS
jgi:hypothetical protein